MILVSEARLPSLTPFWSGQEWRCRKWKRSWSRIELKGEQRWAGHRNQSQYLHRSSSLLCHWSCYSPTIFFISNAIILNEIVKMLLIKAQLCSIFIAVIQIENLNHNLHPPSSPIEAAIHLPSSSTRALQMPSFSWNDIVEMFLIKVQVQYLLLWAV